MRRGKPSFWPIPTRPSTSGWLAERNRAGRRTGVESPQDQRRDAVRLDREAIELSGRFGSVTRALGSLFMGIGPEKSLRRTLTSIREALLKPGVEFALPPAGLPECGDPYQPASCTATSQR